VHVRARTAGTKSTKPTWIGHGKLPAFGGTKWALGSVPGSGNSLGAEDSLARNARMDVALAFATHKENRGLGFWCMGF